MILGNHHHLQGLTLGVLLLGAAAAGLPALSDAAHDLTQVHPPVGKVVTLGPAPKAADVSAVRTELAG